MLDFASIEKYKENNRIEAKKALGGLPKSIWETYSAFANTLGGVILLGVEEYKDKSFHTVDLPDPYGMVKEFYEGLNDPHKVNINILPAANISVMKIDGNRIIVIEVPKAGRLDKPVYINGDMEKGVYRRGGEGDYKCTPEEIAAMVRDASMFTADMKILEKDAFEIDSSSFYRFKKLFSKLRPGHPYLSENDGNFLVNIGAATKRENEGTRLTVAGALMFGTQESIARSFPEFFLVFRCEDKMGNVSFSKGRGGNVFDFYTESKIATEETLVSCGCEDRDVIGAVLEALVNGITNVDYYRGGASLSLCPEGVKVSNSGAFRVSKESARKGEVSDPRNAGLAYMLSLVNAGKGMGKGIVGIYDLWHRKGWSNPIIRETFEPEKTTVEMPFSAVSGVSALFEDNRFFRRSVYKEEIIYYLTKNITGEYSEIVRYIKGNETDISEVLSAMLSEEIISEEVSDGIRFYRMKA